MQGAICSRHLVARAFGLGPVPPAPSPGSETLAGNPGWNRRPDWSGRRSLKKLPPGGG